jgi:hypothetical protein
MIEFPSDEEILEFACVQRIGEADVVLRDLARIATIFHLQDAGFFDRDTVLAGGMALRCYGGHRFTVTDVDTSTNERVALGRLDAHLNWEIEGELVVRTMGVGWYQKAVDLEKAKPILFEPLFSEIALTEGQAQFELTVNMRGLDLPPVERGFRHDFPWVLGIEGRDVPLMDPREMLAEKVVGYCVNVLGKHYADVAFLAFGFQGLMSAHKASLRSLVETKLERGREVSARGGPAGRELYARVPNYAALRAPLEEPERHLVTAEFGREVRFVVSEDGKGAIRLRRAKQIVRQLVIPWLFD